MKKAIIATLYSYKPVIASAMKLSADYLHLLIDMDPDSTQEKAISFVKEALKDVVEIKTHPTEVYDIVRIAENSVRIIDSIPKEIEIILNVSGARKTKAFGLLFAGYARFERVSRIIYVTKEDNQIVPLPKLSFNLNNSESMILKFLKENNNANAGDILKQLKISKAMLYKSVKELKMRGLLENETNLKLTDAGKISVL